MWQNKWCWFRQLQSGVINNRFINRFVWNNIACFVVLGKMVSLDEFTRLAGGSEPWGFYGSALSCGCATRDIVPPWGFQTKHLSSLAHDSDWMHSVCVALTQLYFGGNNITDLVKPSSDVHSLSWMRTWQKPVIRFRIARVFSVLGLSGRDYVVWEIHRQMCISLLHTGSKGKMVWIQVVGFAHLIQR